MRSWLTPPKFLPTEPAQSAGPVQKDVQNFFSDASKRLPRAASIFNGFLQILKPFFAFRIPFWSLWEPLEALRGDILAVFGALFGSFLRPCGKNASRGIFWRLEGSRGTPRMSFWHTQASVWRVSGLSVSGCLLGGKVAQKTSKMDSFWNLWGHFGDVF